MGKELKIGMALGVVGLLVIAGAFAALLIRTGDDGDGGNGQPSRLKGITLTPKSFQGSDFTDFLNLTGEAGEVVSWAGDWAELDDGEEGGPEVLVKLADAYDYVPVVEVQLFEPSTGEPMRPLSPANIAKYESWASDFCDEYEPPYIALGMEVNILFEHSQSDYNSFVSLFSDTYDSIKEASPDTQVFTIFQLERMKGLRGGLFGGVNDIAEDDWELLEDFGKADFMGFTTYPGLIFKDPSDIPADYYSEIANHTAKRIAFTEVGWSSSASPASWESSESEQAEYVDSFFHLAGGLEIEMAIWCFMYDQPSAPTPFISMGLFPQNGPAKEAWQKWVEREL